MTTIHTASDAPATPNWIMSWPAVFLARLLQWQQRATQRHHLRGLDDRMLEDMGMQREDAEDEAGKPFWQS